jgi:uncharacterized repeat protein (TIGR03803 family)
MAAYVSLRRSRQTLFPNSRAAGALNPPGIASLTVRVHSAAIFVLCATIAMALGSQTSVWAASFKTLHTFDIYTDGAGPNELVQAANGNLYGTTEAGGVYPGGPNGNGGGTVFTLTRNGALRRLWKFCYMVQCPAGANPFAGLVQATNGSFYGTTSVGGPNDYGTILKITPDGTLARLHSFDGTDGANPFTGLVQATNGNFYGTTSNGGASGSGTIFKINPNGTLTTLYSFCSKVNCSDGNYPNGLVQATNGNFYGTTMSGGTSYYGPGTIFKITPDGTLTTLHRFCSRSDCTDGSFPNPLIQATDGNFYGTTNEGGANGYGTIFKITANGALATLHSFDYADGEYPEAALIQATDGNFYGTTAGDGTSVFGSVFEITPNGALTTLHSFDYADGEYPEAALIQATDGNFYGTTNGGGAKGSGTVFEITP